MATQRPRFLHCSCLLSPNHLGRALLLTLALLPSCAVYDSSLLDTQAGVTDPNGGATSGNVAGGASGGNSNSGGGGSGGTASASNGGMSSGAGSGSGANGGASNEGGTGNASAGGTSSGNAGSTSGGTTGSAGTGGTGTGTGNAGASGSSGGAAGAPSGGSAGAGGAPINPCDRVNWKATASKSSTSPNTPPSQAIDGVANTRWSSGAVQVGGEWFLLDLGAKPGHLTQVSLDATHHTGDEPLAYKLEVSNDGKTFTVVCTGTGAPMTVIAFPDTPARYLRITQTGSAPDANWWSIEELTLTCSI